MIEALLILGKIMLVLAALAMGALGAAELMDRIDVKRFWDAVEKKRGMRQ